MAVTGYSDTFGRTVAGGLGTATSGQVYSLLGVAAQFSVAPNTASIAPSSSGDKAGYVDRQTSDIDIVAQVSMSAIPATNLATVGFVSKLATIANYYNATMMVAAGGAISLRFSKVITGGLSTLSTTATGLTYVANAVYNLHYQCYWSNSLQTNVMNLKLWAANTAEPGGWMATFTDAAITQYAAGTSAGIMGRDESTALGSVITKIQNVAVTSYNLPMPAGADPMCADPAVTFPKQTALQSLALAADTVVAAIDPLTSLAALYPRVRISNSQLSINTALATPLTYAATEFNIGTDTSLGYDNTSLYLPVGIWLLTFEIQLAEAASNAIHISFSGGSLSGQVDDHMRSNPAQANDQGVGGCGHMSSLSYSADPTASAKVGVSFRPVNTATTYVVTYMALSAIKISDYFV